MECNTNRIRSIKLWKRITEASMKLITEEKISRNKAHRNITTEL